jgi:hypothetical protein
MVASFGAAAACLWLLLPQTTGILVAALVLALGIAVAWDRALLAGSSSPRALQITAADAVVLELADGSRVPSQVGAARWVSRFCVVLPLFAPRRRTLLLTGGMLAAEPFRILRLWALWGRIPGGTWPAVASGQLQA